MTRVPNGKLFTALEAMEGASLTAEQKELLRPAYENALSVIRNTVCDSEKTEKAQEELLEAMRKVGLEPEKETEKFSLSKLSFIEKLDKFLFDRFGGNGFFR